MKLFFKKYIVSIIFIITLFVYGAYAGYQKYSYNQTQIDGMKAMTELCIERHDENPEVCVNNKITEYFEDAHTAFSLVFSSDNILVASHFIIPLLFLVIAIYPIYLEFKSKNIKNILMRSSYKEFMKSNYKKILLFSLVIPLFLVFVFLLCFAITKSLDINKYVLMYGEDAYTVDAVFRSNLTKYYFFYFINIYLLFVFIGNIGLFFVRKSHNFAIVLISSMITYILIDFITEIVISRLIVFFVFKVDLYNLLNLLNFWDNHNVLSMEFRFIFILLLVFIFSIINYFWYNNKEMVLVESQ